MKSSSALTYRPDIDGLRAIAVLSVVAFHGFPSVLPGGFVGVDVFFVISGFLISRILFRQLAAGSFSFRDFYAHRIVRLFPSLGTVLAVCCAVGWSVMQPDQYRRLGQETLAGAAFFSNLLFWRASGYFDAIAETKPLLHLWSLGVEEQFYLFWPLLLAVLWRVRVNFLAPVVVTAILSLGLGVFLATSHPAADYYSPFTRMWELMAGALLAYLVEYKPAALVRFGEIRSILGVAMLGASLFILNSTVPFPGWAALLPVAASFLLLSSPTARFNSIVLASPPLRWIGLISYPFYLWHWPLLFAVRNLGFLAGLGDEGARAVAIAISLVLSVATYVLVEKPIRFGTVRKISVPALSAGMAAVVAAAVAIIATDGFSYRIDAELNRLSHLTNANIGERWRDHSCFLEPEDQKSQFPPECDSPVRPLVVLWGDSHAAMLYPGLQDIIDSRRLGLAQYTISACPPLVHVARAGRPLCQDTNDWVLTKIERDRPQTVLLSAMWFVKSPDYDFELLRSTVSELRMRGAPRIVVFGPAPRWEGLLPSLLAGCMREQTSISGHKYSRCGLTKDLDDLDRRVAHTAATLGVEYVSIYNTLCNAAGCMTMVTPSEVSTRDDSHLTPAAAAFVLLQNKATVFGKDADRNGLLLAKSGDAAGF
jgi:peptidoglycan/LPS O-acetylase OafA/YrhL